MQTQKTRLDGRKKHNSSGEVRRVGFYIRVSTEEQAENPEGSIKNQEERLKMALALRNGDTPFGKCEAVFCDTKSGKDMNRPEFQRLLKAIERGEINMVMVSEVSRLSRSIKDFSQIWEFMQAHGCGFLSLRENFDTSTAAGEMMLFSIANFAQFERRQTSERVSAGFLSRAQRGLWNGGSLPLGYEPDPDRRGSLRIVEEDARTVRVAFEVLLKEGSVSSAARWLNENGYTYNAPIRGKVGVKPRHFTFDSLYRLVSNAAYAGRRVVRSKTKKEEDIVAAVWPAIIDQDTFDRAQKVVEAGKKQKTGREARYPYLLSTRIFCEECGAPLIGNSAHGATTKVPYYGHGTQSRREYTLKVKGKRCNPFRVPGRKIEERVWNEVLRLIESPSHREPLFKAIQALSIKQAAKVEAEKREHDLFATNEKLANLAKRIADLPQGIPADALYSEMRRLTDNQAALKTQLEVEQKKVEQQRLASSAEYDRLLKKLREHLCNITPESKRRIIHALIHKVVVTKNGFQLHFYAGMDQIKRGETLVSPSFSLDKKNFADSSVKYLCGGGEVSISEPHYHHDFIELSLKAPARIFEKCAPLYEKGLSIRDIEEQTGIPKSTVRETLKKNGMALRNPLNRNAVRIDRLHTKRGGHTPYGYAYLDGQLLIDPKEQIVVRKILKLHQSGISGNAIAAELNRQKIPSRTGKIWRPCVVRRIIKSNQTKKTKK